MERLSVKPFTWSTLLPVLTENPLKLTKLSAGRPRVPDGFWNPRDVITSLLLYGLEKASRVREKPNLNSLVVWGLKINVSERPAVRPGNSCWLLKVVAGVKPTVGWWPIKPVRPNLTNRVWRCEKL